MGDDWVWNDDSIPGEDTVLRRVPAGLSSSVPDGDDGMPLMSPAYFQYDFRVDFPEEDGRHEGMSCNVRSSVEATGGNPETLYEEEAGVAEIPVTSLRAAHAGVTFDDDPVETDHVRRASHALTRLSERIERRKKHPAWNRARSDFLEDASWVVPPLASRPLVADNSEQRDDEPSKPEPEQDDPASAPVD